MHLYECTYMNTVLYIYMNVHIWTSLYEHTYERPYMNAPIWTPLYGRSYMITRTVHDFNFNSR